MYQPIRLGARDRAGLGGSLDGRDQWTLIRPILERTNYPLSSVAPFPYSLKVNDL